MKIKKNDFILYYTVLSKKSVVYISPSSNVNEVAYINNTELFKRSHNLINRYRSTMLNIELQLNLPTNFKSRRWKGL